MCMCPSMYCPRMVRVSWDLGYFDGGAVCVCPSMYCPGMVKVSRDLDRGVVSVHVPIHVLSRDGQSILGSRDTLTGRGEQCACTVPGWSEYLGISGYSDREGGAVCLCPSMHCPGMVKVSQDLDRGVVSVHVPIHVMSWDGQSIPGSWDTLTGGCSVLVAIHVLSRDG